MRDKMKRYLPVLGMLAGHILAIVLNFANFLMGNSEPRDLVVTGVYVLCWLGFVLFARQTLFVLLWSGATMLIGTAYLGFLLFDLDGIPLLLALVLFMTPYQGLTSLPLPDPKWGMFGLLILGLNLVYILLALVRWKISRCQGSLPEGGL